MDVGDADAPDIGRSFPSQKKNQLLAGTNK
jgi:hypothetical protein